VELRVHCITTPNPTSNFATSEFWVGTNNDPDSGSWVEEGMAYGNPQGSTKYWFWADDRPAYPYSEHDQTSIPVVLDTTYPSNIHWNGNDQWLVQREGMTRGTSVSNPGPSKRLTTGEEFINDLAIIDSKSLSMQWKDTSDVWHDSWEKAGWGDPFIIADSPAHTAWITQYTDFHYYANAGGC
jgi:hypothetical protein